MWKGAALAAPFLFSRVLLFAKNLDDVRGVGEEGFIALKSRDGAEFPSAEADAFTASEREEKASARSGRNDR